MGDQSAMHCDAHRIYRCTVCEKVVEQARLLGLSASREAKLLARVAELEAVLSELYDLVKGECPALLDEDRGGNARLDIAVNDILGGGK